RKEEERIGFVWRAIGGVFGRDVEAQQQFGALLDGADEAFLKIGEIVFLRRAFREKNNRIAGACCNKRELSAVDDGLDSAGLVEIVSLARALLAEHRTMLGEDAKVIGIAAANFELDDVAVGGRGGGGGEAVFEIPRRGLCGRSICEERRRKT